MANAAPLLAADSLCCIRDGRVLFEQLDVSLRSGELLALLGANGAGKSTLLRCMAGLYPDYEGELRLAPFVYVGHKAGLCGHLSTQENLQFLREMHAASPTPLPGDEPSQDANPQDANQDGAKQPLCSDVAEALEQVGLAGYEFTRCNALSAGQARRVVLARLLLCAAPLWLLDEPLTALDRSGIDLFGAVLERHLNAGGGAICATHQTLPVQSVSVLELTQP